MISFHDGLVVLASFVAHVFIGNGYIMGVWTAIFLEEFGTTAATAASIGAGLTACIFLSSVFNSLLISRLGCHGVVAIGAFTALAGRAFSSVAQSPFQLFLAFALSGIGQGCGLPAGVEIVSDHFREKSSFPLGLGCAGVGIGMFFPMLDEFMISRLGWRVASFVHGTICFTGMMLAASAILFVKRKKQELRQATEGLQKENELATSNVSSENPSTCWVFPPPFFNSGYLCICVLMNIFTYMGFGAFLVHLVKYLTLEDGLSMPQSQAAAAASTIGFINIPGRIIIGWICSFEKVKAEMVLMVCTFGAGAVIAAVPFIGSLPGVIVSAVTYGLFMSSIGPVYAICVENTTGRESFVVGYGISLIFESIGSLLGPPMAGHLIDLHVESHGLYHSYHYALYFASLTYFLAGLSGVWPLWLRYRKPERLYLEVPAATARQKEVEKEEEEAIL